LPPELNREINTPLQTSFSKIKTINRLKMSIMTNTTPQIPNITYEVLMASMYENDRFIREKFAETDRLIKESRAEHEKNQKDYEKRMEKMEKNMGNWSNNHGSFAEEYFFNSFDNEQQDFFGEHFNKISKNLRVVEQNQKKEYLEDEYDIVMYNDFYVAIVEAKFRAHKNDISQVIKKAETFKILCPSFKDFKIYLGLASLSFYPELEQECIENGIAIIKQVGDTVIINDAHLKVY
jgi:hypothetical protein